MPLVEKQSTSMPFADLCKAMQIARGPIESFRPVNAGLLFFNSNPHSFFNRAWIELVIHQNDSGRNFSSQVFKGPLQNKYFSFYSTILRWILSCENLMENWFAENIVVIHRKYCG